MYQHYTLKGEISEIFIVYTRRFGKENPGIQNMGFGQGGSPQFHPGISVQPSCVSLSSRIWPAGTEIRGNLKVRCDIENESEAKSDPNIQSIIVQLI